MGEKQVVFKYVEAGKSGDTDMGAKTADITQRHSVVRLSDIKRIDEPDLDMDEMDDQGDVEDGLPMQAHNPAAWSGLARKTWRFFKLIAAAFLIATIIAWPLAKLAAHKEIYGTGNGFSWLGAYDLVLFLIVLPVTALILLVGYALAAGQRMTSSAEKISLNAQRLLRPETDAVQGVKTVGRAVRQEVDTLNNHVDDALSRLASAEAMIRQLITAIDTAGTAMEDGATGLVDKVAGERQQLINLTEQMNVEADAFAAAIAEKAKLGIETNETANARLAGAEKELEQRLASLEQIALKAFDSFTQLTETMQAQEQALDTRAAAIDEKAQSVTRSTEEAKKAIAENTDAINAAHEAIAEESARLEKLISEQRERADRLAETIASHSEKIAAAPAPAFTSNLPETSISSPIGFKAIENAEPVSPEEPQSTQEAEVEILSKANLGQNLEPSPDQPAKSSREERHKKSWADILKSADTAPSPNVAEQVAASEPAIDSFETPPVPEPVELNISEDPYDHTSTADENDVIHLIRHMQDFTKIMEGRLFGTPQQAASGRFERGERNIFAHGLVRRDEMDVKSRLQLEVARSTGFSADVYDFLSKFDQLLEPTTTSADNLLDDYLGSPLGQVYILVGAAVDYFA